MSKFSYWGWFTGRPSHGAHYIGRFERWLGFPAVTAGVPLVSRALPWALRAYLAYRIYKRWSGRKST